MVGTIDEARNWPKRRSERANSEVASDEWGADLCRHSRVRAEHRQSMAENVETCMRSAGYRVTGECSAPLKTYESCMKIADEIMRGPSANQYRDADWDRICLDNEWDVRIQKRLSADCYQSGRWRRWLGQ